MHSNHLKILMVFMMAAIVTTSCDTKSSSSHNHKDSTKSKPDTSKKSLPAEVSKSIGGTDVKINYHSPAVRGRVIWGGLVPYDQVWVTGAHKATSLEIGKDFNVGGKTIPAGKYALFTIPGREEWTIILNKNWDQHLADDYKESEDVVRVKVKPEVLQQTVERLTYQIEHAGERNFQILISWEKIRIPVLVEII